jgi:hypothetical protein
VNSARLHRLLHLPNILEESRVSSFGFHFDVVLYEEMIRRMT